MNPVLIESAGRMSVGRIVVWIRRELRAQDHLALWSALQDASSVIPLYIIDGAFLSSSPSKKIVILKSLRVLREELKKLGGNLFIRRGEAAEVLLKLVRETGSAGVYVTRSYEPGVIESDARLRALLEGEGKIFRDFKDGVIFEKTEILNSSGEPFRIYSAYRRAWLANRDDIAPPLPTLREMNSPPVDAGEIPQTIEPGLSEKILVPEGGEASGLATLNNFMLNRVDAYRQNRDLLAVDGTSRLSHHLATGSLSPRRVYSSIVDVLEGRAAAAAGAGSPAWPGHAALALGVKTDSSKVNPDIDRLEGINTFLNQIIWRDFYTQILANFPHVDGRSFKRAFDTVPWKTNVGLFNAWRDGVTGYPVVDAAMRQLRKEGWMHNRGRMIVAGFLTKDLHVDWRMGERHFIEWLVDGDLALNNGGWQWAAGTGTDAQPWHRIFNPVLQGQKFDPEGAYVKKYVPELSAVTARYIHSPWEMSALVAGEAGVRLDRDYPAPVIDHLEERKNALGKYRPGRPIRNRTRGVLEAAD